MQHCISGMKCKGIMLILVGVVFLLGTLNVLPDITFAKYWPAALILAGLHALFCGCGSSKEGGSSGCCVGK